jgi:transcriptional repressor NrdR
MKCPNCGHLGSRVMESRDQGDGSSLRRRRECLHCKARFTTYERLDQPHLTVVKKDGRRELFNRDKIAGGIYRACEKRPIPVADIEALINRIEQQVRALGEPEVPVATVGEIVVDQLLTLDDVAYVRFASVYRAFSNVASFQTELDRLKASRRAKGTLPD